ncbi:MAG: hypothetical protein RL754_679 [Bacteroidota bacterium]|jgi:hypothetical protein
MSRFIRNTFLTLAAALWLLHSVVPHVHRRAESGIVTIHNSDDSSFWLTLFGTDLGDDHLEEFSLSSADAWAAEAQDVVRVKTVFVAKDLKGKWALIDPELAPKNQSVSEARRGPPAC